MFSIPWFTHLSTGKKIGSGFALSTLLFLWVIGQNQLAMQQMENNFHEMLTHEIAIRQHSLEIEQSLLRAQKAESSLLLERRKIRIEQFIQAISTMRELAGRLRQIEEENDRTNLETANHLSRLAGRLSDIFQDLTDVMEQLGLTPQTGLQGQMAGLSEKLAESLRPFDQDGLRTALLAFLAALPDQPDATGEKRDDHLTALAAQVRERLASSSLPHEWKNALLREFFRYGAENIQSPSPWRPDQIEGIRQQVKQSLERLETIRLEGIDHDTLALRVDELTYSSQGGFESLTRLMTHLDRIAGKLTASGLSVFDQANLHQLLGRYRATTQTVAELNHRLTSLQKKLAETFRESEALILHNMEWAKHHQEHALEQLDRQLRRQGEWNLLISGAALLFGLLIITAIGRHMGGRIRELTHYAEIIANGALPQRQLLATTTDGDEIGQLARSIVQIDQTFRELTLQADAIAAGELDLQVSLRSDHDRMGQAHQQMVQRLQQVAQAMQGVALGNLSVTLTSQGEKDRLGEAVNQMIDSLRHVVREAQSVAAGDFYTRIEVRGDQDELSIALREMTFSLQQAAEVERVKQWLMTGVNQINQTMRESNSPATLAEQILTFLAEYLELSLALFYLAGEGEPLRCLAGYALPIPPEAVPPIPLGQGLTGQAALGQPIRMLNDLPADYWRIGSGLGDLTPRQVVLVPCWNHAAIQAVLELATLDPLPEHALELLRRAAPKIAASLAVVRAHQRVAQLLEESQAQARELHLQQAELEHSNHQLEMQANELEQAQRELEENNRSLEVVQQELEEHVQQLELSNRYKMEFLANMSHELRTPLNGILLLSQMMLAGESGPVNEEQQKNLQVVFNSGHDLLTLINDILDHAKIASGKIALKFSPIDPHGILEQVLHGFRSQTEKAGLTLGGRVDPSVAPVIQTDGTRLMQILRNFISNALKFTARGEIELSITPLTADLMQEAEIPGTFRQRLAEGELSRYVAFAVRDTGIGIPREKQGMIFEPFQQIDGAINRKYSGTGLGLAISLQIAEALGGGLLVQSGPERGSCFILALPMEPPTEERVPLPSTRLSSTPPMGVPALAPPPPTWSGSKHNRLILIAEDDQTFGDILASKAAQMGYDILRAGSGTEALRLALHHRPDAILLDIQLPVLDGWEVLRQLKKNSLTRHIPVQVISGDADRQFGYRLGALEYLVKPVQMEEVEQLFRRLEDHYAAPLRKLLVVAGSDKCQGFSQLLEGGDDLCIRQASSREEVGEALREERYDCIVVDLHLPGQDGFDILEAIQQGGGRAPTVVCTEGSISLEEESRLRRYADTLVMKSADSQARLLEETTIFLHRVEDKLRSEQRHLLASLVAPDPGLARALILLVDDDVRTSYAMTVVLEKRGARVLTAANGREALELLESHPEPIALILMDLMMPEMDGLEAMRRIRQQKRLAAIPIIALTAKAMPDDRESSLQAGASDYLTKPVDYDRLLALIQIWLASQRGGTPP